MLLLGVGVAVLDLEIGQDIVLVAVVGVLAGFIQRVLGSEVGKLYAFVFLEVVLGGFLGVFLSLESLFLKVFRHLFDVYLAVVLAGFVAAAVAAACEEDQACNARQNQCCSFHRIGVFHKYI